MYSYFLRITMKLAHQIGSLVLALVVIITTMGVTVHKHYCKGRLVETAVFVKTKHSHCEQKMAMKMDHCQMHDSKPIAKDDCCSEKSEFYLIDDLCNITELSVEFKSLSLQAVVLYFVTDLFSDQENILITHKKYKPPLIAQDVHILVQSFLL